MAGKLMLGNFTFELGPKNQIDFKCPRSIAKLDIPGGVPKYQDMGEDEHTISWTGILDGEAAPKDLNAIIELQNLGREVQLLWGSIGKKVRIKEFSYSIIREDRISYSMSLIEIQQQAEEKSSSTQTASKPNDAVKKVAKQTPVYIVKKGNTLYGIAQKLLGKGSRWIEIAKLNKIKDPRKLQIGTKLKIPAS